MPVRQARKMIGRGKAAVKSLFNECLREGLLLHLTSIFTNWGLYKITSRNSSSYNAVYNYDKIMTYIHKFIVSLIHCPNPDWI
jgi:hypothetical protein